VPSSDATRDAVGWRWEIEKGEDNRRLLVEVSTQAMGVDPATLPEEVRLAKATQGQRAVESVLDREDPPGRISFTTTQRTETPYGGQARTA
jgi:hypothetical protein